MEEYYLSKKLLQIFISAAEFRICPTVHNNPYHNTENNIFYKAFWKMSHILQILELIPYKNT